MNRPSVRDARRLAEVGPPRERSPGDYAEVALPAADADVLVDVLGGNVRSVIDVGLAYGSSALAIAEALATNDVVGGRHVIIDPHQGLFQHVGVEVLAAPVSFYELIEQESQIALPSLVVSGASFDAAFLRRKPQVPQRVR